VVLTRAAVDRGGDAIELPGCVQSPTPSSAPSLSRSSSRSSSSSSKQLTTATFNTASTLKPTLRLGTNTSGRALVSASSAAAPSRPGDATASDADHHRGDSGSSAGDDVVRVVRAPASIAAAAGGTTALAGRCVLVVDDERTCRRVCERMLTRLQCSVVCLEDGDQVMGELLRRGYSLAAAARRQSVGGVVDARCDGHGGGGGGAGSAGNSSSSSTPVAFQRVDVVLMDIMMERSNGVDVAVELRACFKAGARRSSITQFTELYGSSMDDGDGVTVAASADGDEADRRRVDARVAPLDVSGDHRFESFDAAAAAVSMTRASPPRRLRSQSQPSSECAVIVDSPSLRRARCTMPPLVAMTANTSLANIETYKRAGFRRVLPKPFDVKAMVSVIEACLGVISGRE
jgi:CheY-like chemotaxis protein